MLFEEKNQGFIYFQIDSVWGFAESQNYLKLIRQIKALKKKIDTEIQERVYAIGPLSNIYLHTHTYIYI